MADGVNTKPLSADYCSVVLAALMSGDTSCHQPYIIRNPMESVAHVTPYW